ncbi:muellerian-inhibiting factor [Tachyglossus aculeatus]|uniref:muellerian-inhibiting factor n=1 Tax=Tachyglossus aculeatus TaxID=9261 RepID=UPI0018F6E9E6|nr:muellerian-inhibiting factor [Tachyglossus aculeatus]
MKGWSLDPAGPCLPPSPLLLQLLLLLVPPLHGAGAGHLEAGGPGPAAELAPAPGKGQAAEQGAGGRSASEGAWPERPAAIASPKAGGGGGPSSSSSSSSTVEETPHGTRLSAISPEPGPPISGHGAGRGAHPWAMGGLRGPVCRVRVGGANGDHLEVVGSLSSYESGFLEEVRQAQWGSRAQATFGICPPGDTGVVLSLQQLGAWLVEPGGHHLVVLHLEEVMWRQEPELRFQEPRGAGGPDLLLGSLDLALLVFYPGQGREQEFTVAGDGLQHEQNLCLSQNTRYLVLGMEGTTRAWLPRLRLSLAFWPRGGHGSLSPLELQTLLFGPDDKCFTRMTPVLLLLRQRGRRGEAQALPARGQLDVAPYPVPRPPTELHEAAATPTPSPDSNHFLEALTHLVRGALAFPAPLPGLARLRLDLDPLALEGLPQRFFNFSEPAMLEQLVESEEPLLLHFPAGSRALLEGQAGHWRPEEGLARRLAAKLQGVAAELLGLPALQPQAELLQRLLDFCQGVSNGTGRGGGGGDNRTSAPDPPPQLHALLLLKALQSLRAEWQERRKVSRAQRSAESEGLCRLQELSVDLRSEHSVLIPETYMANNCQGRCSWPQSDRNPNYNNHVVLLLKMQARGVVLTREPCCVPTSYAEKTLISLSDGALSARLMPNMVVVACGCR